MKQDTQDVVERARRINQAWITRGNLAANTRRYFDHLATVDPVRLEESCRLAVAEARKASDNLTDPKLPFYAALFSRGTKAERDEFLKEHFFTRLLSAEMQLNGDQSNSSPS